MPGYLTQQDFIEAFKIGGFVFAVSAVNSLFNNHYKICQNPFNSAVQIGLIGMSLKLLQGPLPRVMPSYHSLIPSGSIQEAIIEVSKICANQCAVSAAILLLNNLFKISTTSVGEAVIIGLLSIPMGLSVATLFTALTGHSIFQVPASILYGPPDHRITNGSTIAQ